MSSDHLDEIAENIRENLEAKYRAREKALVLSRETIRSSAVAIRAIHRREFDAAENLLAKAAASMAEAVETLRPHPQILYAGFVQDAQKELAEGHITLALVGGRPLPTSASLRVDDAPYLNGLGEAAGELRRHLLDRLRDGEIETCERLLQHMDDIYSALITMDYPDAMTGGLRRTTDMVRGVTEKTRGDLTSAILQRELGSRLEETNRRLKTLSRESRDERGVKDD